MRFAGHEENGLDFGREPAIHEGHLEFVFVVGDGANAADDDAGSALGRIAHEQAIEGDHFDIGQAVDHFGEHVDALFDGEEGLLFVVAENGDDEPVEERGRPVDEIQVAAGDGVEGARIDGDNGGGFWSQGWLSWTGRGGIGGLV